MPGLIDLESWFSWVIGAGCCSLGSVFELSQVFHRISSDVTRLEDFVDVPSTPTVLMSSCGSGDRMSNIRGRVSRFGCGWWMTGVFARTTYLGSSDSLCRFSSYSTCLLKRLWLSAGNFRRGFCDSIFACGSQGCGNTVEGSSETSTL